MWKADFWIPVRTVARWPVATQIGARRNALVACTVLARRRAERDEVERFLSALNQLDQPAMPADRGVAAEGR
jgi:hypothetical protein